MKVCYVRSYQIDVDSRLKRYHASLARKNIEFMTLYWDRHCLGAKNPGEIPISLPAKVGSGGGNGFSILRWQIKLLIALYKNRKNFDILHAVDFDSIIPAYIISRLFGKRIIFDIYDKYTDARNISGFPRRCIDSIENYFCKNSDVLILADELRINQHGLDKGTDVNIIENVPGIEIDYFPLPKEKPAILKVSYAGSLEHSHRGIENLLECIARRSDVELNIAGFGALSDLCMEYSKKYKNIKFHGRVESQVCLEIMRESHIVFGMYYKTILNHLYAAPNKYYEHLVLGRPLVSTEGTPPGIKVDKYKTGWAIGESKESIDKLLDEIKFNYSDVAIRGENARSLWINKYKKIYSNEEFDEVYKKILIN